MNPLHPDHVEERHADRFDDVIPTRGYALLPLVGLGGSAGSIPALTTFFRLIPPDSGMAFVVVLHLAPQHESHLAALIQRVTAMPVSQACGGERVEANHVYVIPPGKSLSALDGHLQLEDLASATGRRVAVDLFLRTLADTYGPHATAVVLSGADGDGAIGIRRIKERGGLTIAQDPLEAEHSGMPRSAIATGLVDWVLPVADIPGRLIAYQRLERHLKLPPEKAPAPLAAPAGADQDEQAFARVLELLQARTGRDFRRYKRGTIVRRLARRMQLNGLETLGAYLEHLRDHPPEARALLKDLLVSVTNFFRDSDHFEALVPELSRLFAFKGRADTVRIWVAGCATGEEAYSLAMLLHEQVAAMDHPPMLRVLATDLDADAIRAAREGFYPPTIAADVSPERLHRFFTVEAGGYRVRSEVRETVLFAVHDLLTDSPFSRIDLMTCRNLLIYLDREAQRQALDVFHFALRPGGILFLGASESLDDASPLFGPLDPRHHLYVRRPAQRFGFGVPAGPGERVGGPTALAPAVDAAGHGGAREAQGLDRDGPGADRGARAADGEPVPARTSQVHRQLMERFTLPSVMVDGDYQLMHVSAGAGRFLRLAGGAPTRDLLRLVQPGLRVGLRAVLDRAASSGSPSEVLRLPVEIDARPMLVDITVAPADELAPQCLLVVFDAVPGEAGAAGLSPPVAADPRSAELLEELTHLKAQLRDLVEQHEASTEQLRASNEELQAMNEDLRSTTEELEVRRQEAQSMNEELAIAGVELKRTAQVIGENNRDLHNLMESMSIAMVFLDRDLRITFYTPAAVALFRFIPTDVGRPLADLAQRFEYPGLLEDARCVLEKLVPIEREVRDERRWLLARVQPCPSPDHRIAGVVLTFTDVTERRDAEIARLDGALAVETRVRHLEAALSALPDAICTFDAQRRLVHANEPARRFWGLGRDGYVGRTLPELGCRSRLAGALDRELQGVLAARLPRRGSLRMDEAEAGAGCIDFGFAPAGGVSADASLVVGWLRERASGDGPAP